MAQDMSTYFTGVRRNPPNWLPKTRTVVKSGAAPGGGATPRAVGPTLAASRNRRLQSAAGVEGAAATGAGARAGARGGAGAAPGPILNRRRPVTTRLTGGGPAPPSGIFQSPHNSLRRPQTGTTSPARSTMGAPRRFREIEWIMKPSKNFVQCSESSSEDNFPDRLAEMQTLQAKTGKRRSSWSSGISSVSEDNSRERWEAGQSTQQLVNLLKTSCRGRAKKRPSRVFCVPDQRIMHSEELLQAQMLQMHPRRIKSPLRYSYNPAPTPSLGQGSPSVSPSRRASEKVLIASLSQPDLENPNLEPPTGLISCSPSPIASPKASQIQVQPPSRKQSHCSLEKSPSSSSSSSSSSCPSQILIAKPTTGSNHNINNNICNSSSNNSSLSSSGTECSAERVVQRYRGPSAGSKAVKLTSTVIKIMPDKAGRMTSQRASRGKVGQHSRIKLRSKTTSQFLKKGARDPAINQAMNAPMIQSIAPPPVSMSKVKVSQPIVSQSVSQVVNQLTVQLKKAVGEECKSGLGQARQPATATATAGKWPRQLGRKTSIYLLMDQAKPDQTGDEPSPSSTKNDWVIQPMRQQMISPATDQPQKDHRNPAGSERLSPYSSDSKEAVGHNYDIYLNVPGGGDRGQGSRGGDPAISRYNPEVNPSYQAPQPMIESLQRNSTKQTLATPSQLSLKLGSRIPEFRKSRWMSQQPVSLNRISRPRVPAVPVLQQQPKQVQQQVEEVAGAAGKIVRKTQHKVPRTMEDGIDMSYQYFVSLPLKRGRKPQVVRYLYRPMVRHLNGGGAPNGGRRSSKRAKRRRAAAAAAAAAAPGPASAQEASGSVDSEQSQQFLTQLDPELVALGGAPLPLEEEEIPQPKECPTLIFDSEEALNSPYHEPPLKLKSCYMPMLEELEQMPYPDERLYRRRRNQRRTRAAGGSDQLSPPENDVQPVQGSGGGGDDKKLGTPVIVWSGRSAPPVPRTTVVNYQAKPTRVPTTTGAPMMFHQPLRLTLKEVDCRPMIRTITYETIEQEEREELEERKRRQLELKLEQEQEQEQVELELKVEQLQLKPRPEKEQLERERLAREQLERERLEKRQLQRELQELELDLEEYQPPQDPMDQSEPMAKSVSFHPESVFVSRGSTTAFESSSTTSIVASKDKSKKRKAKKSHAKGKGKGKGRK